MFKLAVAAFALLMFAVPALAESDTALTPEGPPQPDATAAATPQTTEQLNAQLQQLFGVSAPFAEAFAAIQQAVGQGDAAALSKWIAYPLRISHDDQEQVIETPQQFVDNYDDIVTDDVAEAVTNQSYESLFANADGVMFGNGEMWMTMICKDDACTKGDVKIITIQSTLE